MRNPLNKRLFKELTGQIGKYLVIFLFLVGTIGFISGFLVAGNSMLTSYDESYEKYNVEDGNFKLLSKIDDSVRDELENEDITIYENYYYEKNIKVGNKKTSTLRIFKNRNDINKACVMEGNLPKSSDEIAIDRMYADNNSLKVGDSIKIQDKKFKISGLVSLPDYTALFYDNGDMMFDAIKFGVSVMTEDGFNSVDDNDIKYVYSWKYKEAPKDDKEAKEKSDDFIKVLNKKVILDDYIPAYQNQAINFAGDDLGKDKSIMTTLLYILIIIIAFVFAVTISNTIASEASVIGTLRASGYSKGELLRHYLAVPLLVTIIAAIIGNVCGYTFFKNISASLYYGSYSLPTYVTVWNAEAFILTTVIPVVIMLIINLLIIANKLSLSPLKFLRHDLKKKPKKKSIALKNFKFFTRFRLRIIFQNMPNYLTLFIGIIFANTLLLFGMMLGPLIDNTQDVILDNMIAKNQYILKAPIETKTTGAEKASVSSLDTTFEGYKKESVNIYGVKNNSNYVNIDFNKEGVYISSGIAEKFSVDIDDNITLKDPYTNKKYKFKVRGIYDYDAALAIFTDSDYFNDVFNKEEGYFNTYFSDTEIKDIDQKYIASHLDKDDYTKLTRQLDQSMGSVFGLVKVFAILLFILLIYLLSKLIIEKNQNSISMVKILGYKNGEIGGLYILSTTLVVILSLLLSFPITSVIIEYLYKILMKSFTGWMTLSYGSIIYVKMFILAIVAYLFVAILQFYNIKRIPMDEALKNVE